VDVNALAAAAAGGDRRAQPADRLGPRASTVVWHDLECGAYTADLPLWRELAAACAGAPSRAVLDVGAGSGRVALDLAGRGACVTALDLDAELLRALRERAAAAHIETVETVRADARTFALARQDYAVCVAPMQTIQLLGGASARIAFLRRARMHLAPGGVLACAIVTDVEPFDCAAGDLGPSAEVARLDGATYISRTTRVHVGRRTVRIERERRILAGDDDGETVPVDTAPVDSAPIEAAPVETTPIQTVPVDTAPVETTSIEAAPVDSAPVQAAPVETAWERDVVELDRVSVAQLQHEGREADLTPTGARAISATAEHTGSVAVLFGA
jgi:SAM-dependent methyltransferase